MKRRVRPSRLFEKRCPPHVLFFYMAIQRAELYGRYTEVLYNERCFKVELKSEGQIYLKRNLHMIEVTFH